MASIEFIDFYKRLFPELSNRNGTRIVMAVEAITKAIERSDHWPFRSSSPPPLVPRLQRNQTLDHAGA
jgi:hypothetical protein